MITAYQAATGAYLTEYGDLLCDACFASGDDYAKPISNYGLDEEQTAYAEGYEWSDTTCTCDHDEDDHAGAWLDSIDGAHCLDDCDCEEFTAVKHDGCEPALFDTNGHLLLDEYHDHPTDVVQNPAVPRWVPCSQCQAGDGEPHRPNCPTLIATVSA